MPCFWSARCRCSLRSPARQRRGAAWWTAAGAFGAAIGPALGGILTQAFDWRAIFVVQAPLAGLALLATVGAHLETCPPNLPGPSAAARARRERRTRASFSALSSGRSSSACSCWSPSGASSRSRRPESSPPSQSQPSRCARSRPHFLPAPGSQAEPCCLPADSAALALLPSASVWIAAAAMALCGAGLGLAVPVLSHAAIRPEQGLARSGAWSIGARHLGLVVALVARRAPPCRGARAGQRAGCAHRHRSDPRRAGATHDEGPARARHARRSPAGAARRASGSRRGVRPTWSTDGRAGRTAPRRPALGHRGRAHAQLPNVRTRSSALLALLALVPAPLLRRRGRAGGVEPDRARGGWREFHERG